MELTRIGNNIKIFTGDDIIFITVAEASAIVSFIRSKLTCVAGRIQFAGNRLKVDNKTVFLRNAVKFADDLADLIG